MVFIRHCGPVILPCVSDSIKDEGIIFGYLFSLTLSVTSFCLELTVTYISWSSDFCLVSLTLSYRKTSYTSLKQMGAQQVVPGLNFANHDLVSATPPTSFIGFI